MMDESTGRLVSLKVKYKFNTIEPDEREEDVYIFSKDSKYPTELDVKKQICQQHPKDRMFQSFLEEGDWRVDSVIKIISSREIKH